MRSLMRFLLLALIVLTPSLAPAQGNPHLKEHMKGTQWVNLPKPGQLPAGVTRHTYRSKSMGHDVGYLIYLPREYASSAEKRYPVIYNLHGAGGDELHSFESAELLERGIAEGRWPPSDDVWFDYHVESFRRVDENTFRPAGRKAEAR